MLGAVSTTGGQARMSSSGISIYTNVASLQTQRQFAQNSAKLRSSFERLSSGLRIVHASDDAAGLAIARSLEVDNRVYTQGIRNLNDGLSYLNIAEGAIEQLKAIVMRARELATQSANGVITDTQRSALHQEAEALGQEYNRILTATEFNGGKVFDASNPNVQVQFGYGANEAISARTGDGAITPATSRISVSSSGTQANAASSTSPAASISADGRYAVFMSSASNLVSGDTNGQSDVFLRDMQTGEITRVNTTSTGAQATGGGVTGATISADGRFVLFASTATNLVSGDTNGVSDVFLKDLQTGSLTRVSTSSSGDQATGGQSDSPTISADGRYISFFSDATNLVAGDSNGLGDIFVKDMQTGLTTRVNTSSTGAQATGTFAFSPAISANGRYVVFSTGASNLISGDTNGMIDVFRKDLFTGEIVRVNTSASEAQGTGGLFGAYNANISADGRYIAFSAENTNLVSGDTNGFSDIFVKDLLTGSIIRANTDSNGAQAVGWVSVAPSLSADGRFVAFQSGATNLVPGDTNGIDDIFVKDLHTGKTERLSVSANGSQASGGNPQRVSMSADGRYVIYQAALTNLVSGDTNGVDDVFFTNNTLISSAANFSSLVRPMVGIYLKNQTMARMAQSTLDDYLKELNTIAGYIGSSMSAFSVAVSTLGVRSENIASAASRIMDVDVADESSELLRRNTLQQASSAILAQANLQPQIALKLLNSV